MRFFASISARRRLVAGLIIGTITLIATTMAVGQDSASKTITRPAMPDLIVVRFHADWCRACTTLKPTYTSLQERFAGSDVLFVTLDLTSKHSRRQAEFLAASMRLDSAWIESGLRTGQMLLVTAETQEVLGTVSGEDSIDAAAERISDVMRRHDS